MSEIDPLVQDLIALCEREGGHKVVAAIAGLSADAMWQVIHGIRLPSGKPKGVGPTVRRKLNKAYPDWQTRKTAAEPEKLSYDEGVLLDTFRLIPKEGNTRAILLSRMMGLMADALQKSERVGTPAVPVPSEKLSDKYRV